MSVHTLEVKLDLPEETLSLAEVRAMAKKAGISFDDWISRCVVGWTRIEALHLSDPEVKAYFDAHRVLGPINLDPESPNLSRYQEDTPLDPPMAAASS